MNKIIHEQSRLRILSMLATTSGPVSFPEIRDKLEMTAGNLSIQLKTLEESGYIKTEKYFQANKPRTDVHITAEGRAALMEYLEELEELLRNVKKSF